MKITREEDYAITFITALCKTGSYLSLKQISLQYALPKTFLKKIARKLKNAGLLKVKEGRNGGYRLSRKPKEINLGEILRAFNQSPFLTTCLNEKQEIVCDKYHNCQTRQTWRQISSSFYKALKKINLENLKM